MKKTLLAVVFALASVNASASEAITISYELLKNGELISKASGTVEDGHEMPFIHGSERGYVKAATRQGSNTVLTPGVVFTGFKMAVTPILVSEGKVRLVLKAEQIDLIGMDEAKNDDLIIQIPRTGELLIQQAVVIGVKPAQFSLGKTQAGNNYVLLVMAKTGGEDTLQSALNGL